MADGRNDGSLKLNTDIITYDYIQNTYMGDFPIRGLLFSGELNEQSLKNEALRSRFAKDAQYIDFSTSLDERVNILNVTQSLFTDYHPQIIPSKKNDTAEQSVIIPLAVILSIAVMMGLGIILGIWRAKRKSKYLD